MNKGMFLYPWDIEEKFSEFEFNYLETGCNMMAAAMSYHHGTIFSPRNNRLYNRERSSVSFEPKFEKYGQIKPILPKNNPKTTYKIREWSMKNKVDYVAWIVYLHNSSLGEKYPEFSRMDAWNNRHVHSLCPSNIEVLDYSKELTKDICEQFSPSYIAAESLTPLSVFHGSHHEISNVYFSKDINWLLSICFCKECMRKAQNNNIDSIFVKKKVSELLDKLTNSEVEIEGSEYDRIVHILYEYPEIYKYTSFFQKTVARYIAEIDELVKDYNCKLQVMPSATPYNINQLFMESFNIRDNLNVKHYLPLVYGQDENISKVKKIVKMYSKNADISLAVSLNSKRFRKKEQFLNFIESAIEEVPHSIYYYNYSIISRERLSWIKEANEL